MGTLSVVSTPIGNLADLTLRALDTLKGADVIACEDTRVTSRLLARYGIEKPLIVYHARIMKAAGERVLSLLAQGKRVALVTDAGTPGISDPGVELVALARERLGADARVETIPGPSALVAALSVAGVNAASFVFLGFLPHKKGRQKALHAIAEEPRAVVFYESPHRILKTLAALETLLPETRPLAVCRELTKIHEEVVRGSAREVRERFSKKPATVRGEFVVVVGA